MAFASAVSFHTDFAGGLDALLLQICEELQLTPARYDLAVQRYESLNQTLDGAGSPFRLYEPEIYPQGSMALGTTVAPILGPHDLDFVLQLSRDHHLIDPMKLIRALYEFLHQHGTYASMTSLKNRCVRIEYSDEFFMDILPACVNVAGGGTCLKVPDRAARDWSDSNPLGYVDWFKKRSRILKIDRVLDRAAPIPEQQAVAEKDTLQLVVQLLKRWRDRHYRSNLDLAPISIVLTTLAGLTYQGERSVSQALQSVLSGIIRLIDVSRQSGQKHLRILNPSNEAEDLSERWDSNPSAYQTFERGIRDLNGQWSRFLSRGDNVNSELEALFGEPVKAVLRKRALGVQQERLSGKLAVASSGLIKPRGTGAVSVRPNNFYGEQ